MCAAGDQRGHVVCAVRAAGASAEGLRRRERPGHAVARRGVRATGIGSHGLGNAGSVLARRLPARGGRRRRDLFRAYLARRPRFGPGASAFFAGSAKHVARKRPAARERAHLAQVGSETRRSLRTGPEVRIKATAMSNASTQTVNAKQPWDRFAEADPYTYILTSLKNRDKIGRA